MIYLRSLKISARPGAYPFNSPALTLLSQMDFSSSVTIIVGENGSGKSTLMEALARLLRLPAVGASDAPQDDTLSGVEPLSRAMRTVFARRPSGGFFLRAEDFFGYTKRIGAMQADMRRELQRVDQENIHRSAFAKEQARAAYAGSLYALNEAHGVDPDARSHGESFLDLFSNRIHGGGIYLLDEPEAPLSPMRQLALTRMIMDRERDAQFLIATHSPILAAYPGATLWCFDHAPAQTVRYEDLENVRLMRDFLNAPNRFIQALREDAP